MILLIKINNAVEKERLLNEENKQNIAYGGSKMGKDKMKGKGCC